MTPAPERVMLCGLFAALSVMLTLALRVPVAEGVKLMVSVQLAPIASVLGLVGQVAVSAKSPVLGPASAMLVIVKAAVPALVSVTDCVALVVPTF